ncbi:SemiSWEET family transporter [Antarcticirhabdus aurantiaca]|uniref:SemiSWEET family transporter n=1 Tax=Antarcticirhabdus aurantiaca TaxID=2606717 RepID=A0ACD4NN98_9HYPH|nr:SemiSWEET family transporter [Antarcticirhabdus aurantiaca]WAJ28232.1 SemiSWEET family transporter [Jeongeuplla avenae]
MSSPTRRSPPDASSAKTTGPIRTSVFVRWLGWAATLTAMTMFLSYIDQIRLNLAGQPGSIVMPLATVLNCGLWSIYGALRRDWPVAIGNCPGVALGAITFVTAL